MAGLKVYSCACCGSDVTYPQWHNGNVYGYTCISKVAPAQKRTKDLWVLADSVQVVKGQGTSRMEVVATVNSLKYTAIVYGSLERGNTINTTSMRLTGANKSLWKSITVNFKEKTAFDKNGVKLV